MLQRHFALWAILLTILVIVIWVFLLSPNHIKPSNIAMVVEVVTPYPGASVDIIAYKVSDPLARDLRFLSGIGEMRIHNEVGLSRIILQFYRSTNPESVVQSVDTIIKRDEWKLPEGTGTPTWALVPVQEVFPLWV